jgi:hypothetical protein
MGLPKTGQDRFSKYSAKFDPTTIGNRFTQVKEVALARAQNGMISFAAMQDLVKPILDKYGVAGPDRAKYLGFANKLMKHINRSTGDAATSLASGLKSLYVTAFKADPAILDEIVQVVAGWVTPY